MAKATLTDDTQLPPTAHITRRNMTTHRHLTRTIHYHPQHLGNIPDEPHVDPGNPGSSAEAMAMLADDTQLHTTIGR